VREIWKVTKNTNRKEVKSETDTEIDKEKQKGEIDTGNE
jgi:hypothetical protein